MKTLPHRLNGVKTEIVHVVKQRVEVWYIKAMDARLTTLDHTVQADYRTYVLTWYLVTKIGYGSLSGLDINIHL